VVPGAVCAQTNREFQPRCRASLLLGKSGGLDPLHPHTARGAGSLARVRLSLCVPPSLFSQSSILRTPRPRCPLRHPVAVSDDTRLLQLPLALAGNGLVGKTPLPSLCCRVQPRGSCLAATIRRGISLESWRLAAWSQQTAGNAAGAAQELKVAARSLEDRRLPSTARLSSPKPGGSVSQLAVHRGCPAEPRPS
jgi:hypothetical protein